MEIKRASIITPPVTPRNSMLLGLNQAGLAPPPDQKELQDFLRTLIPDDQSLCIPEVGEYDRRSSISGTSTEEEDSALPINSNNNNNNNNNNNAATPTHFPMIGPVAISSSSSGESDSTLGDKEDPHYLVLTPDTSYNDEHYSHLHGISATRNLGHSRLKLLEYHSEDPLYATPIVRRDTAPPTDMTTPLVSVDMTTPITGQDAVPPTNMAVMERNVPHAIEVTVKKHGSQYRSLADLTDDGCKHSMDEGTQHKEHCRSLEDILGSNKPTTAEKKPKRKIFGFSLWRKNSQQMDTDSPTPLIDSSPASTPLIDTSPSTPVPISHIPYTTRSGYKSISYV